MLGLIGAEDLLVTTVAQDEEPEGAVSSCSAIRGRTGDDDRPLASVAQVFRSDQKIFCGEFGIIEVRFDVGPDRVLERCGFDRVCAEWTQTFVGRHVGRYGEGRGSAALAHEYQGCQ